jgi:hypothetical protein
MIALAEGPSWLRRTDLRYFNVIRSERGDQPQPCAACTHARANCTSAFAKSRSHPSAGELGDASLILVEWFEVAHELH